MGALEKPLFLASNRLFLFFSVGDTSAFNHISPTAQAHGGRIPFLFLHDPLVKVHCAILGLRSSGRLLCLLALEPFAQLSSYIPVPSLTRNGQNPFVTLASLASGFISQPASHLVDLLNKSVTPPHLYTKASSPGMDSCFISLTPDVFRSFLYLLGKFKPHHL